MEYIEKLRIKHSEKLKEFARMHLSFILDLNDANLEQIMDSKCKKKKLNPTKIMAKKDNTFNSFLFGAPLTHEGVCVIYQLIHFIEDEKNLNQEGIFRKSGSASRQAELRNWLNCGTTIDLNDSRFTVHDCATVLKAYLSELPDPLLTSAHFKAHCQIAEMGKPLTKASPNQKLKIKEKQLKAVQLLLLLLPDANRRLFQDLMTLLHTVDLYSQSNKMNSISLATLFAPHMFCPKSFSPTELHQYLHIITQALQFMIENAQEIFNAPKELVIDAKEYLMKKGNSSCSSLDEVEEDSVPINTVTFCQRNPVEAKSNDYTQMQLAQLYAHVQSMPETPNKKKLIKQFNKLNGHGTPIVNKYKP